MLFLHLPVLDARGKNLHGLGLVLVLAAVILALDNDPRGKMCDPVRRIRLVDMLPARTGSPESVDPDIGRIDVYVTDVIRLRHHGNRTGRRMDTSLRFRHRNTLYTMAARFEFQS